MRLRWYAVLPFPKCLFSYMHAALPRHSVMYSVVELLEHSVVPGGLSLEKLRSFTRPPTQVEQIQRIKTVSQKYNFSLFHSQCMRTSGIFGTPFTELAYTFKLEQYSVNMNS